MFLNIFADFANWKIAVTESGSYNVGPLELNLKSVNALFANFPPNILLLAYSILREAARACHLN